MSRFVARNFALMTGALALSASMALAGEAAPKKLSYTPADPDHYPYHGVVEKNGKKINIDGAVMQVKAPIKLKKGQLKYGKDATPKEIAGWNVDVRPDGKGLPAGQMTVEQGAEVFANNCAMCHGDFGEGVGKNPVLVGGQGTLTNQALTGGEDGPEKTLGSFAPYITPFFWYIKMAMPLPTPKKLTNDEVYGIIGYLLQLNEIQVDGKDIEDDTVINAAFLKKVHMPNEKGFEYNNLRKPDTHNTRCMKDCRDMKKWKVMHIKIDATESIKPTVEVPRYNCGKPLSIGANGCPAAEMELPKKAGGDDAAASAYKASCAGCHDSGAAGAPVVGNKDDWASRIKEGEKTLYEHAIKGFNGMPPKGGNMSLSDDQVKAIVDYMVKHSK
ncbi:c-type cytochrome [Nitratifractor salsuginis]|uniref:Cytochrome c class I n=1 Tax=Nitratifractor salsuginis (strain DSM 16511 / JCM 12458 / E9I37-1) TaxID=749222 RepID=E6WZX4_NITSE|nr:c-type cytochrome [Nitratifractor salsuginis]ADV45632.1 cytochrome c class I [Nitratifractor salsuginis DSM 16511]